MPNIEQRVEDAINKISPNIFYRNDPSFGFSIQMWK